MPSELLLRPANSISHPKEPGYWEKWLIQDLDVETDKKPEAACQAGIKEAIEETRLVFQ